MPKKSEITTDNDEKDLVQNQGPKSEYGTAPADINTPPDTMGGGSKGNANTPPDDTGQAPQDDTPELESLSVLSNRHRVPTWQQAALMRLMGWNEGKKVYDVDYTKALEALKGRRIGGGRME